VRTLEYEALERREMMASGVTAVMNNGGVLNVRGTGAADRINFIQTSGRISIAGTPGAWSASAVRSIVVELGGGNDYVSLHSQANGGRQNLAEQVTIRVGAGSETVRLPNGSQLLVRGNGATLSVTASGQASLNGRLLTKSSVAPTPAPAPRPTPAPCAPPRPAPTPANWFDANVIDAALRSLGRSLFADNRLDRNDMLKLLRSAQDGGVIDAAEYRDLRKIAANAQLFGSQDHVWKLTSYVVMGNAANARYQGAALGNLTANASSAHLQKLVNKWFVGADRPAAQGTYRLAAGSLFVNGPSYADVRQGQVGDCYLLASLAEAAYRDPSAITSMFIVNGDGTYTVKYHRNGQPQYVTVDSYLPTDGAGRLIYAGYGASASNRGNELWVSLAEKAYAQINEMGWLRTGLPGNGQNAYAAISGGYIYAAMSHVTGKATKAFASTAASTSFTAVAAAFQSGKMIGFASKSAPALRSIVPNHAYAVVNFNAVSQTVSLYNPWGPQYGIVTLAWSSVQANFAYFDQTV
jgi:hypothetical protein